MDAKLGGFEPERNHGKESNPTVFSSYVREAKIYDESMVARWKFSMDGIVIYAALFSAVVTAFIIESYKTLSRDSGDVMIVLLLQMSQQLAARGNGSQSVPVIESLDQISAFSPSRAAVITNAFWFPSLSLSLACALIATLIQQWASDYIHAIERRQAPERRARIRAFLFEGVENSNVSAIVDGTPVLLHISLFSFLVGLVIFMQPINSIITYLLVAILTSCASAYSWSTVLPLVTISSPIRTPVTLLILKVPLIRNTIRSSILTSGEIALTLATILILKVPLIRNKIRSSILTSWVIARIAAKRLLGLLLVVQQGFREMAKRVGETWLFKTALERLSSWTVTQLLGSMFWSTLRHRSTREARRPESLRNVEVGTGGDVRSGRWRGFPKSLLAIWTDKMLLRSSSLDDIRETIAIDSSLPGFQAREENALLWTVQSLTDDTELLPFVEGIPAYLNTGPAHGPIAIMKFLLNTENGSFAQRLGFMLYSSSSSHRITNAAMGAQEALLTAGLFPFHQDSVDSLVDFLRLASKFYKKDHEYQWLRVRAVARWREQRFDASVYREARIIGLLLDLIAKDAPDSLRKICSYLRSVQFRGGFQPWISGIPDHPEGPTVAEGRVYPLLMALSVMLSTSLLDPSNILNKEATFIKDVRDYLYSVRFLAVGTPSAQQVYATATHAIACIISDHPNITVQHVPLLNEIRDALCSLVDPTAVQFAVPTFKLPLWWRLFNNVQVLGRSRFMEDSCFNAIHWVCNLLDEERLLMPRGPDCPVKSLVGVPPPVQREIAKKLSAALQLLKSGWSPSMAPHGIDNTVHVFQLLSTLDDPEAVMKVQQILESFIRPNHNLHSSFPAGLIIPQAMLTYEALRSRSQIPEFALQAIAVRTGSGESSFPLAWSFPGESRYSAYNPSLAAFQASIWNRIR